ncbi:MAG: ATP-binding protein [Verrucomicrobiota bacterium]
MKTGFVEKLIERVDRLEPEEVQASLVRLLREKGFLERVFDALQEGVIVLDRAGRIAYINGAACRLFGLEAKESVGMEIDARLKGLNWESLARAGKVVSRDLEVFYPENRYLNFYVAPIEEGEGSEGTMLGHVMIVRDITKDRRVEEEKIESERLSALTMLAAGVAHELGNPLNSLTIHLQLMERKLANLPEDVRGSLEELVGISRDEIKRLDFTISQFLGAIRPTQPQLELTDVNQLVEESVRFLEVEMADRKIVIDLDLGVGLPLLPMDRNQFKQAIYNLVKNGAEAIGDRGTIRVETAATEYNVIVRVEDDGAGISAEEMGSLGQPYFTTKERGTGLGLLIVRRIVREHGGEIEFESEEGQGTRVTVYLPTVEKRVRFLESGELTPEEEAVVGLQESEAEGGPKPAKGRVVGDRSGEDKGGAEEDVGA